MLPHKTPRGAAALDRLSVFEGVPPPFDKQQRQVVPSALRVLRLRPRRPYCDLGRLSSEVGWKYLDTIKTLEAKRKVASKAFFLRKQAMSKLVRKAKTDTAGTTAAQTAGLAKFGLA